VLTAEQSAVAGDRVGRAARGARVFHRVGDSSRHPQAGSDRRPVVGAPPDRAQMDHVDALPDPHRRAPWDEPPESLAPRSGPLSVGDYVRRVRREADRSQRELAIATGLSVSWVARVEAGTATPRIAQFETLLALAGWRLAVLDGRRREVHPLLEYDRDLRDGAGRRYPAHLDTVIDPERDEWWAGWYGLARPPETFRRNRWARDRQRARSQFELGRGARRQQGW
jgi:transcriptional regulator with XRE-family HTH domain